MEWICFDLRLNVEELSFLKKRSASGALRELLLYLDYALILLVLLVVFNRCFWIS